MESPAAAGAPVQSDAASSRPTAATTPAPVGEAASAVTLLLGPDLMLCLRPLAAAARAGAVLLVVAGVCQLAGSHDVALAAAIVAVLTPVVGLARSLARRLGVARVRLVEHDGCVELRRGAHVMARSDWDDVEVVRCASPRGRADRGRLAEFWIVEIEHHVGDDDAIVRSRQPMLLSGGPTSAPALERLRAIADQHGVRLVVR